MTLYHALPILSFYVELGALNTVRPSEVASFTAPVAVLLAYVLLNKFIFNTMGHFLNTRPILQIISWNARGAVVGELAF